MPAHASRTKSTVWGCTTACYDPKYIETAGATADGTYIPLGFRPQKKGTFDCTASNHVQVKPT